MASKSTEDPRGYAPRDRRMPKRDMVKLWVRAGGRCTICEKDVQEDGQEGHIVSFGKNGCASLIPLPLLVSSIGMKTGS